MADFVSAAFPWIIVGIGLVLFVAYMHSNDQ